MSDQTDNAAQNTALMEMTAEVVAAYVAKNAVPTTELAGLISGVYNSLNTLGTPQQEPEAKAEPLKPAVPIKKSITDDYIISLEDGRKLKSMKRYLAGLGMTPQQYKQKWGLDASYPMTAPSYAAKRSELAKALGLGRKPSAGDSNLDPLPIAEAGKRGRKKVA